MEQTLESNEISKDYQKNGVLGYFLGNLKSQALYSRKTVIGYLAAWTAWAVILWAVDLTSIFPSYAAKAVLATIVWACIIWITEAIPVGVTGLMIPMLLVVTKAVPKIPEAFSGFTLDVSFMTLGAFIFAAIMSAAKLDTRIALLVIAKMKASRVGKIIIGLFTTNMVLSLVIPAANARSATVLPIINGVTSLFGDTPGEKNAKKALAISCIVYATMVGGILFLTAHLPNVLMVGLFDKQLGVHISWIQWFWLHLPIVGLFPIMYWIISFTFKCNKIEVPGGLHRIQTERKELGKTSRNEWVILGIFAFAAVMWALEDFHKIKTGMITLIALGIFFIPGMFQFKWNEIQNRTIWGTWLLLGGALSLSAAMGSTGLAKSIATLILPLIDGRGWIAVLLIMMFSTQFIRLGMLSNIAAVAMLAPVLLEMAPLLHLNPVAFTLLVANVDTFAFVVPTQVVAGVVAYSTNTFSMWDYFRAGLPTIIVAILWSVFVMAPWYALNGFPIWQQLVK
ncbi:MAG TPA: DASS family sodium-coupled anion symporter [Desulfomonilaceae bacterium]|nr:DASS family sodium-coupled anion symporter [Desulfomonilaceae bacterium]